MAVYKVAYNATNRVATILPNAAALPSGSTNIGTFNHDDPADSLEITENHVWWHHVRDAMYKIGKQDMHRLTIVNGVT